MSRHEMFDNTPVVLEEPGVGQNEVLEDSVMLDSSEAVDEFERSLVSDVLERARQHGLDLVEFEQTETAQKLEEFRSLLVLVKQKIEAGEHLSEIEEEQIQMDYNAIGEASLGVAVTEGLPVDIDNEAGVAPEEDIASTGVGVDLSVNKEGVKLQPASLDEIGAGVLPIEVKGSASDMEILENPYTEEELTSELYGMKVPDETSPVYAAASFREGLKVAVRHDKDLLEMPDKQQLFDELIGMLDYVPSDGLGEVSAGRVKDLVRKINTPNVAATIDELPPPQNMHTGEVSQATGLSPEKQLQADLAEFGQVGLEADRVDEVFATEDFAEAGPSTFTPETVAQTTERVRERVKQEKSFQNKVEQSVNAIEEIGSSNVFTKFFNKSPYESLSEKSFDELIDQASGPERSVFIRTLREDGIVQKSMDNWVSLAPEIRNMVDTKGKTFREVVEKMVQVHLDQA